MTTNAAEILAARLRSYAAASNQAPQAARGFTGADDLESWRRHHEAAQLVSTVDHLLQGMDAAGVNVDMFVLALPRWYAGVHFATLPWDKTTQGNSSMRPACREGDINLLEALGLVIRTGGAISLDEDERRALTDVLAEARNLVENDTADMPSDVRHYLLSLILRAEMVVKNLDDYGTETVRQVAFELGGAMTAQAEKAEAQEQPERASRWRATGRNLMIGFMGGTGQGVAGQLGEAAQHVVKQIGG